MAVDGDLGFGELMKYLSFSMNFFQNSPGSSASGNSIDLFDRSLVRKYKKLRKYKKQH